jgi:hypothetical protein
VAARHHATEIDVSRPATRRKPDLLPTAETHHRLRNEPTATRPWGGLSEAVKEALERNVNAMTREYSRIPFPVRFRTSGALEAWARVRRAAGAKGASLERALADARISPFDLVRECLALVDPNGESRHVPKTSST